MIALRRLQPEEWPLFRAIRIEALRDSPGNYLGSIADTEKRGDAEWRAMLRDPGTAVFGLFDGDAIVGLGSIFTDRDDPATALLAMSYVAPAWRGRGLTALTYGARLDWARERGFARIVTGHRDTNIASKRAILRHGFRPIATRTLTWPDGTTGDDIDYELMLARTPLS